MMTQEQQWLLDEKYNGQKTEGFLADSARLEAGEPLAYIIGHTPFLGTTIYLDSRPLIPRTETEFWVEKAINEIAKNAEPKVLDLCAGSGCIGVAVLAAIPTARVTFAEIDAGHISTIEKNIHENYIDISRAHIVNGNLFENISDTYDVILSNPPYIDREAHTVHENVTHHEPHLALFGGPFGMEIIERIIGEASAYLTESGTLYMEHEPEQSDLLTTLAEKSGFTIKTNKDQFDKLRYSVLSRTKH